MSAKHYAEALTCQRLVCLVLQSGQKTCTTQCDAIETAPAAPKQHLHLCCVDMMRAVQFKYCCGVCVHL